MASRRHLRKEEEEELKRKKKELKQSYEKARPGSKKVGSKRVSDTQKYVLVGSVAIVIILIVAVQFLIPPKPICYFTERDYVYATLDQDKQQVDFSRIVAHYTIVPEHASIDCDITDYFNSSYNLALPSTPVSTNTSSTILYQLADVSSTLIWATTMVPRTGATLQMSPWINKTTMLTPSTYRTQSLSISFRIAIITQIQVDRFNASLQFIPNNPSTTLVFNNCNSNNTSFFTQNRTIFTQGLNLSAKSTILLSFVLEVYTTSSLAELNLLQSGSIYLVKNNQLLEPFAGASAFKESVIDFTGFGLGQEPTLKKTKTLTIAVNIPYYNISISNPP